MGMGMSTKEKYPKALLLPGTGMPLFDFWGEERKGKNCKSPMLRRPQQTETGLLKGVSASMLEPEMGNINSVSLRNEAIKDFPLMDLLVTLDYMNLLACSLDLKAA